jgi:hypothetical protein
VFTVAVAQPPHPPPPRKAAGQSLGLALLIVTLGLIVILCVWLLAALRRGRRLRDQAGRTPPTRYTDAWSEAGRRFEPPPEDAPDRSPR